MTIPLTTSFKPGEAVPDFTLEAAGADKERVSLSDYRGRKVILYFYPKDMTSACTLEACDFQESLPDFTGANAVVLGVSPDSVRTHARFRDKHGLAFVLLSDPDHIASEAFGVWQLKKLYGREYMGVVRSTFLINEEGRLVQEWRNMKVKGHAAEVLACLTQA